MMHPKIKLYLNSPEKTRHLLYLRDYMKISSFDGMTGN